MYNFSSPGGRTYLSFRSSNPNPSQRFVFTISNGFALGLEGIRELGAWLIEQADAIEEAETPAVEETPAPKKTTRSRKKKTEEGDADAAS